MNRIIKFRVWNVSDVTGSKMYYDVSSNFSTGPSGALMQFTGLKDKNGKEIYEGDVVQDNSTPMMYRDEVRFERGRWTPDSMFVTGTDFEIIGNIYEHPELLNPNQK